MAALDILSNPAFAPIPLTRAARRLPYVPQFLGSLNLFDVDRIRTSMVAIRSMDGKLALIPTTERGGDPVLGQSDAGEEVYFKTPRLAKRQRKQAHELQNLRDFENPDQFVAVQDYITRIQASQRRDMELTHEFHRLGAIQGKLLDANGTTVLANFFTRFNIAEPALLDFELDDPATDVRAKCTAVKRAMTLAGKGVILPTTRIYALAGDNFFDLLVGHAKVVDTFRYQEGQRLRDNMAYTSFDFGGITWVNYRGTDTASPVAIPTDEARFFPVGAPGVFGVSFSPFEGQDFVNTPGEDVYSIVVRDMERGFWFQPEIYSYPFHYCALPAVLQRAKKF
jgi:hypothetical protein